MSWIKQSNSCGSVRPRLWEYAAGDLQADAAETSRIESHLALCPKCRAEAEAFRVSADAMTAYVSTAPETGIPPRTADWDALQMRLEHDERRKDTPVSGMSWLRAMRTSPAFAGATLACGLCTALSAFAIPWALQLDDNSLQKRLSEGAGQAGVGSAAPEAVTPRLGSAAVPVEMMAQPAFSGTLFYPNKQGVCPIAVSLVNHTGRELPANLSVATVGAMPASYYRRKVVLSPSHQIQTVLVYPSAVTSTTLRMELLVTLAGDFPRQESRVPYYNEAYNKSTPTMALIGDAGSGVLYPKRSVTEAYAKILREKEKGASNRSPNRSLNPPSDPVFDYWSHFTSASAKPETAPDRIVGYAGIDTLVLGQGAERLNAAQRSAIRQWVIGGGSVILLPGAEIDLLGIAPDALFSNANAVSRLLPPKTPLHRYALGLGAVLTVGADLTQSAYRDRWELPYVWNDLRNRAAPGINVESLRKGAREAVGYAGMEAYSNDPFRIALPPVTILVYLFAGYFVLAVPITFIVLKRTRRMNLAWATGPTLAAVFGCAVYGFTADLYKAKLSRRTSGMLFSAAGERQARFVGTSELFFPAAGSYDVTVPNAETMGPDSRSSSDYQMGGIVLRSMETVDNGTSVSVPRLSVTNLAFRRLKHTQPVSWGEGLTADLRLTREGGVVGTIQNRTGWTLKNACLVWKPDLSSPKVRNRFSPNYYPYRRIEISRPIAPGVTKLNRHDAWVSGANRAKGSKNTAIFAKTNPFFPEAEFILVATVSGEALGPTIGQYVGGPDSVTVAVALPPIRPLAGSTVSGGTK